jgi:hypothetical protein
VVGGGFGRSGAARWVAAVGALMIGLLALSAAPAAAVPIPHPEETRLLTVQGTILGQLRKGGQARFIVVATDPLTFSHLQTLKVVMLVNDKPLQEINFDVPSTTVAVSGQPPVDLEHPAPLSSGFFQVHVGRIRPVRATFSYRINLWVTFLEAIPKSTRFRFFAIDRDGQATAQLREPQLAPGFLSWPTLGLAVVLALALGLYVGYRRARARYGQKPSVWAIVERQLRDQRGRPPSILVAAGDGGAR